mmetsp:Transcript_184/g.294  ORF Transcript_184/g.294 Transcript_184/m.294 type:complete len:132 (-) Transcript_184:38-433(-)
MELMSSFFRPLTSSSALPTFDCKAENRSFPFGSQSKAKFTAPLQRLQTPSKRIMGRLSVSKTRCETILGSSQSGSWLVDEDWSKKVVFGVDTNDDLDMLTNAAAVVANELLLDGDTRRTVSDIKHRVNIIF